MLEAIVFYTLAAFILGFGVMVVTARNTVHSVLFLVANFLCVAVLFSPKSARFSRIPPRTPRPCRRRRPKRG
jgi:NADH:ubiquinone oxidoreductase subunit 6 (subunit J)